MLYLNLFKCCTVFQTYTNANPLPTLSLKARPISSRGRSTGECRAATWRWRQDTPASSPKTGCCAPRCSRTLRTRSPKARRRESTCTITRTTQRMDTRCARAPLTPPRLWAPALPHLPCGCCHLSGRSRWPSALNCYDAKARDKVLKLGVRKRLFGGGPVDAQSKPKLEHFCSYKYQLVCFCYYFCCYLFHMPFDGHLKRLAVCVVHTVIILSYSGISRGHQSADMTMLVSCFIELHRTISSIS